MLNLFLLLAGNGHGVHSTWTAENLNFNNGKELENNFFILYLKTLTGGFDLVMSHFLMLFSFIIRKNQSEILIFIYYPSAEKFLCVSPK